MLVLGVLSITPSVHALDPVDDDNDSVSTVVEDSSTANSGDNNYDGATDSTQNQVASLPNPNDVSAPNSYVTLQVGDPNSEDSTDQAWKINEFKPINTTSLPNQPEGKVFPLGMFDIELSCQTRYQEESACNRPIYDDCDYENDSDECNDSPIDYEPVPANLALIFNRVMDTNNWTTMKFDPITNSYIDYSSFVTIEASNTEFGYARTVVKWSIFDGGLGDADGIENGYISDPIGPSVPVATATTSATTLATTVAVDGLQHTGSNFAIYSLILGFLMVAVGAVFVRKS
ncbi:MAG: choice-of-anchor U domain-containing protein [Patescibacteria group bacterium]